MDTVNRCCRAANIPVPNVYLSSNQELNAYAVGRNFANSKIVINQGLLNGLTPTQLMGVIAHEISHIANRDCLNQSICMVFCEALEYQARFIRFLFFLMLQTFRVHFLLGIVVFLLSASTLIPLVILSQIASRAMQLMVKNMSRTRELRADVTGARLCRNPIALAEALEILEVSAASCSQTRSSSLPLKIRQLGTVNPVSSQIGDQSMIGNFIDNLMMGLLSTHPPLDNRIRRLRLIEQERRRNM
jgi:heat shock protein HtpX